MNQPAVTVYNAEKRIKKYLSSVLPQTFQNFELILLQEYGQQYSNTRVVGREKFLYKIFLFSSSLLVFTVKVNL
ncbi:glycosyltransferase family A protein [Streptococcus hyointestinalis]|nr:glycosyltransferase family A protein [Streptococcus hyointestinalis]